MYIRNILLPTARRQIYFSDSGRFLCVNVYFGASIHLILFFVSNHGKYKPEKSVEFSVRTIKICRFEIIDGVKYVYCIKHAYKFPLREQVGFATWACVNVFLLCTYIKMPGKLMVLLSNVLDYCLAFRVGDELFINLFGYKDTGTWNWSSSYRLLENFCMVQITPLFKSCWY